jgi:signal transduction histidine kinase
MVTSLITIGIVYRRMDERIEGQMEDMSSAILNMAQAFLLDDDFLSRIKIREVVGADIIAYTNDGEVTATTLHPDAVAALTSVVRSSEVEEALLQSANMSQIRNIHYLGQPYKVIYRLLRKVDKGTYVILSLIVFTGDIAQAKRRSAVTIGLVAVSGILLVALVGIIIARSITAPVKQLVEVTEQIAAGDLTAEAEVKTRDEIGALSNSFNQMTRELKASRDKLIQSEKLAAVGQLAAGIAHEIRNPLTSIKMIVQLLRRRFQEDESGRTSVQAVLDEISRLEIIISGLLDFARPMELDLQTADVTQVMNDVLSFMEADLRHRKIQLVRHIDENVPKVMLDENRIKQVFMNVILNSMQAMPEGGELAIECRCDDAGDKVQLVFSDTGIGMSQEILDQAFEPFFSNRDGGTGLGLANVEKIIELHGGSIQLESTEGQGTKVIIKLEVAL